MTTVPYETSRPRLDVSHLATSAFDTRAPAWWGNLLMTLIETTTVLLILTTYLYLHQNFDQWPPPRTDMPPTMKVPFPDLKAATIDLVLLGASCGLMYFTDSSARAKRRVPTMLGLGVLILIGLGGIACTYFEFKGLHFRWNDNAYASTMWWIIGLHFLYILAGVGEFFIMCLYLVMHEIDAKHALDVTLAGFYWYWVAGAWAAIYAVTYVAPRLF